MKKIALLGSTGSIGRQVLSVVDRYPDKFKIVSLTANDNGVELEKQINKYKPKVASLTNPSAISAIREVPFGTNIYYGEKGLLHAITNDADVVVVAVTGFAGFKAVSFALNLGKKVALANKESLVAGGEVISGIKSGELIPVDSEHSAIWQCLGFDRFKPFKHLLLTASGGAFRSLSKEQISQMPASKALEHPTWKMGKKITIDCATMMNKGLEVIEAKWLFNTSLDKIKVVVHPQSVVHSMVAFDDGAVISQMGYPSMEVPIQLALTYPDRIASGVADYDFYGKNLTFEELDVSKYPCFELAIKSGIAGGNIPCAMSAANEQAVEMYLQGKIKFYDISDAIEFVLNKTEKINNVDEETLVQTDALSRALVRKFFGEKV